MKRLLEWLRRALFRHHDEALHLDYEWRHVTDYHVSRGYGGQRHYPFRQYFCDVCDAELEPRPSGAGTNQICPLCNVNFGCLPCALDL